jgi:hypothetical protein
MRIPSKSVIKMGEDEKKNKWFRMHANHPDNKGSSHCVSSGNILLPKFDNSLTYLLYCEYLGTIRGDSISNFDRR